MYDLLQIYNEQHVLLRVLLPVILGYVVIQLIKLIKSGRNYPPGPIGLPILGYLPFLGKEPHVTLHQLGKKYGNVIGLRLGTTNVVILDDIVAEKEAFSLSTTIDRPPNLFSRLLPGGSGFSESNGQEWTEQRRFCVRVMRDLGLGRGQWEELIKIEVENFVSHLKTLNGNPVDLFDLIASSIYNNIASLILGKTLDYNDPKRSFLNECIEECMRAFSQAGLQNYFPIIHNIMIKMGFGGQGRHIEKLTAFADFINDHIKDRMKSPTSQQDFINCYLEEMKNQEKNENTTFHEKNLRGNIQTLMLAGSDTSSVSLCWLLLALVAYPEEQKKVQQELDSVLGPGNVASWEDRYKLPYTFAVIMEGQRWRTLAPLNTSRIAQEDIQVCGYDISKGTVIIANNWGIHNDTRYWTDPEEFRPARFMKPDNTVILKPDSYVPFSYGRRNCPGETVATMEILFYLSALLSNFDVHMAEKDQKHNLEGVVGLTYTPIPQKLRLVPRTFA